MIKLLKGVVNFHETVLPGLRKQFDQLATNQSPDALMIACSDSRVVPNLFASTDPGDLFVVRNVGNLIPAIQFQCEKNHFDSETAAIEIAVEILQVKDIIVCGHSNCAGMATLLNNEKVPSHVQGWMQHGQPAKIRLDQGNSFDVSLNLQDQLSQLNVIVQLENLKSYPQVQRQIASKNLRLHGWWFDVQSGNVYAFDAEKQKFVVIDEIEGNRIIKKINGK